MKTISDIDNNVYHTVKIGSQEWMAENLDVSHYRNGDLLPQVQGRKEWAELTTGAWCYYKNKADNGKAYGKLYNWYAVNDPRGLAPQGWQIPSDEEWTILIDYLGGGNVAGGKLKDTETAHWNSPNTGWKSPNTGATNESRFSARSGGIRFPDGEFNSVGLNGKLESSMGIYGSWWSSTENDEGNVWYRNLTCDSVFIDRFDGHKNGGYSIRCVKD